MVWSQSSGTLRGHEGQPLVVAVGSTPMLYMESGWPNIIQALDLTDPDHPKEIWNYKKTTNRDDSAVPRACCDTVNRGMSYADGKLVFGTLDGFVIALDAKTGKEVWVVKHAYPDKGETITPAPIIADDKVIIGFGGDEFAARGRVTAYDLQTGKKVWECYSTGSDKDVCLTPDTNKANPEYGTAGKDLGITQLSRRRMEARRRRGLGLVQLRSGAEAGLLLDRQPRPVEPVLSLRTTPTDAGGVQRRQVRQQVVDDHLRAQGRHRRGGMGLSDDAVRPVGL